MSEGTGAQRYCTSCGAKVRSGISFCVSCGASLASNTETPSSADNAVASEGEPNTVDGSLRDHRASQEQDGGSPQSIYDEYALHRRFFQEARDGLIRFSRRLKQGEDGDDDNEHLTHNDLAGPLLRAQMGLDKAEEYKKTLTAPLLSSEFSLQGSRSMLTELGKIQKEVLTSLETFWDKLEAQEGHAQFKDEFAGWYTESLEPRPSAEPTRSQRGSAPVSSEPPSREQQEPPESPQGVTPSELANRVINWFRDLPSVPKLVLVGVLLLLLLTVLSPVARVVAFIVFVVSAVVLVVKAIQRKPLRGWLVAVVGSLLLIPVFGGISGAIYGSDSGSGEVGESESLYDTSSSPSASNPGGSEPYGSVAPGLEEAAKEWASEAPMGGYILVPGYLPFKVEGYDNYLDPANLMYRMYSDMCSDGHLCNGLEIAIRDPSNYAFYEVDGTIQIDGRSYSYTEMSLVACQLDLWETSGGPQAFHLYFPAGEPLTCMSPEELVTTLESMVRVEGTDGKDR